MVGRSECSPESVVIRRAKRADLEAICRIESVVFDQPWSAAMFEQFLGEPVFLVVECVETQSHDRSVEPTKPTDDILGYVVADVPPTIGRDVGHIKDLAVHPAAQGNGLGRTLLQRALLGLTVAGAPRIKLEVRRSNERAISLYRSEGFEPVRLHPSYYDDGESALVMMSEP